MKKTSLKELKEDLSKWTEYAARGEKVYVSRYNKPYIVMMASATELVGVTGSGDPFLLKPAVESGIPSRVLMSVLEDDRGSKDS